jgi:hypothetical protein
MIIGPSIDGKAEDLLRSLDLEYKMISIKALKDIIKPKRRQT